MATSFECLEGLRLIADEHCEEESGEELLGKDNTTTTHSLARRLFGGTLITLVGAAVLVIAMHAWPVPSALNLTVGAVENVQVKEETFGDHTYVVYAGPGKQVCGDPVLSEAWVDGKVECQSKCNSNSNCSYYSFWSSSQQHWKYRCRLTRGCASKSSQASTTTIFKKEAHAAYYMKHSAGKWCDSSSLLLWSGSDVDCKSRCTATPDCWFYSTVGDYCQLSANCSLDQHAHDSTANTFKKVDGKCMNAPDQKVWMSGAQQTFDADMLGCSRQCLGAGSCVTSCMSQKAGYSNDCAECIGGLSGCTTSNCFFQCLGGPSQSCSDCANAHCEPLFRRCAGLDIRKSPPSSP